MELVWNEWLLEYMTHASGRAPLVGLLLDRLEANHDLLAVRYESPFVTKLYRYKKSHLSPPDNRPFKRFFLMMFDPAKVRLVYENEIAPLPQEVAAVVPADDLYLIELASATPDKTVVTTDETLIRRLNGVAGFHVVLVEEFLSYYLPVEPRN